MKKDLVKYRSLTTQEIVWSYTHWPSKMIGDKEFLPVTLHKPSQDRTLQLYHMAKEFLEEVK